MGTITRQALVADADPVNRKYLATVLERAGWEVTQTATAAEFGVLTSVEHYGLIVVELELPDVESSLQSIRWLRGGGMNRFSRVVGISTRDVAREFLDAGADDFLMKPLVMSVVRERLGLD